MKKMFSKFAASRQIDHFYFHKYFYIGLDHLLWKKFNLDAPFLRAIFAGVAGS